MADPVVTPPVADPKATTPAVDPKAPVDPKIASPDTPLSDPGADPKAPVTPDFPDDWREKLAGGDDKKLSVLKRYASPKSWTDAGFSLRQKLSSGELKSALPKDATPEQVAEWRKDNGIPEKPEGYDTATPEGLVIGDADKPVIAEFHKAMLETNAPPEAVKAAKGWYYKTIEAKQAERVKKDDDARLETEDVLRAEWGNEYRGNINSMKNYFDRHIPGDGTKDRLLNGRMADGTPIMSDPNILRWLVGLAKEMNPAGTIVKGGGDQIQSIDTEMAGIEKVMRENRKAYNKDEKMQERYRQLIDAKEKIEARTKAA